MSPGKGGVERVELLPVVVNNVGVEMGDGVIFGWLAEGTGAGTSRPHVVVVFGALSVVGPGGALLV